MLLNCGISDLEFYQELPDDLRVGLLSLSHKVNLS